MIRPEVEKLRGMVFTPEEMEDVILPIVATSKERNSVPTKGSLEKRLWKARILDTPKNGHSVCLFQKEYYTDVREMSVKEAVEWYNDLKEHLNDYESVYDSDARGLYYKKDGEWVRYLFDEEK